jgi:hypothetical protein
MWVSEKSLRRVSEKTFMWVSEKFLRRVSEKAFMWVSEKSFKKSIRESIYVSIRENF